MRLRLLFLVILLVTAVGNTAKIKHTSDVSRNRLGEALVAVLGPIKAFNEGKVASLSSFRRRCYGYLAW